MLWALLVLQDVLFILEPIKKLYNLKDPLFLKKRELDDKKYAIDHFFKKLLKLPSLMNTETGKEEALKRVNFMKSFLRNFKTDLFL